MPRLIDFKIKFEESNLIEGNRILNLTGQVQGEKIELRKDENT